MRKIFTQETLKRSFKPSVFVALVCMLVWLWGQTRTVDIDLNLVPQTKGNVELTQLELSLYDSKDKERATVSQALSPDRRIAEQRISLRPGEYVMRGIVTTKTSNFIVEQKIVIPSDNASMDIFLRPKGQ